MLNEKQEKFAQAYVLHRNATEEQELETDVDVIKEMESQYEFAKANGHTNSAIKALELLSRIRGANSDTKISTDKDTLEVAIIGCLNVLGYEKVVALLEKCDFAHHFFENLPPESDEEGPSLGSVDLPYPEEPEYSI